LTLSVSVYICQPCYLIVKFNEIFNPTRMPELHVTDIKPARGQSSVRHNSNVYLTLTTN